MILLKLDWAFDMNKRVVGKEYEDRAAAYLTKNGCTIIERNFRNRIGEIDIIMRSEKYLCFVEVKYRATSRFGTPLEAVNYYKRKQIKRVALSYMEYKKIGTGTPVRFDVIGILDDKITWVKNAF